LREICDWDRLRHGSRVQKESAAMQIDQYTNTRLRFVSGIATGVTTLTDTPRSCSPRHSQDRSRGILHRHGPATQQSLRAARQYRHPRSTRPLEIQVIKMLTSSEVKMPLQSLQGTPDLMILRWLSTVVEQSRAKQPSRGLCGRQPRCRWRQRSPRNSKYKWLRKRAHVTRTRGVYPKSLKCCHFCQRLSEGAGMTSLEPNIPETVFLLSAY
jgi:hypothetical protein